MVEGVDTPRTPWCFTSKKQEKWRGTWDVACLCWEMYVVCGERRKGRSTLSKHMSTSTRTDTIRTYSDSLILSQWIFMSF